MPVKYDHIDFKPSDAVANAASRGLELRKTHGRGGTEIGVARARDLSNKKNLSPSTIRRMKAYFDRHGSDKPSGGWELDSAGYIAWMLWGGDSGYSWAKKVCKQMDAADAKQTASTKVKALSRLKASFKDVSHMTVAAQGKLPITKVLVHNELEKVFKSLTETLLQNFRSY